MSFIKTVTAVLLTAIMFVSNGITALLPGKAPEPKTQQELMQLAETFNRTSLADEVIVVDKTKLTHDEFCAVQSLQGLVNRTQGRIYIDYNGSAYDYEIADFEAAGSTLSYTDSNGEPWKLKNLVTEFSEYISDNGYVLYSATDVHAQLNMAFNYTTVFGWLAVPASVEEQVKQLGMEKKKDLSAEPLDFAQQREFYEEYKDVFSKKCLVHLYSYTIGLRDFAVSQKIFITYTEENDVEGKAFRNELYMDLEPASMILGWCSSEGKYTETTSSYGHYVIPSDHSYNVSILSCKYFDNVNMGKEVQTPKLDPDKHYIAIVYSDGDNAQWISNGYQEFYRWQSYDIDIPITWTFAPQMIKFSPTAVRRAYESANEDSFITGPSGAGYARINGMNGKELEAYSDLTAKTMLESGMTTLTLLNNPPSALTRRTYNRKLEYFARYDNIHGGIIQMDTDRYSAGEGEVYFANDKPFVTVRLSLWHPDGVVESVTKEWLDEQAAIVNSYPADINSINGFSVINVHPWTVKPDSLAYFVSQLDDGVEVISADELILAVTENIPHEYAKPLSE